MPLHAENGKLFVTESFHDGKIRRKLYGGQIISQLIDFLVMGAVYHKAASVNAVQIRVRQDDGFVKFIAVFIAVDVRLLHVLNDGSTEKYIDNLHALADAEHRLLISHGLFQSLNLYDVKLRVDI